MPLGLESQYHLNAVVKLYLSQTAFNLKFTGRHKIRTHQNKSATQQDRCYCLFSENREASFRSYKPPKKEKENERRHLRKNCMLACFTWLSYSIFMSPAILTSLWKCQLKMSHSSAVGINADFVCHEISRRGHAVCYKIITWCVPLIDELLRKYASFFCPTQYQFYLLKHRTVNIKVINIDNFRFALSVTIICIDWLNELLLFQSVFTDKWKGIKLDSTFINPHNERRSREKVGHRKNTRNCKVRLTKHVCPERV